MQTLQRFKGFIFENEYLDLQQVPFDVRTDLPLLSHFDTATVAIGLKPRRDLGTEIVCACTEHTTPQIGLLHQTENEVSFQVSTDTTYIPNENTNVMIIGAVIGLRMSRNESSTN